MAPPIAKFRGAFGGIAKRTVKSGCIFDGVGHNRDLAESPVVQPVTDRLDHAVHHPAGCYDVCACACVRHRHLGQHRERLVVQYVPFFQVHLGALAVAGI